jgi:Fe2+ or Zn2+ uptake regulation protein
MKRRTFYYELLLSNFTKDYERKSIQKWLDKFPNLNIRTIYRVLNLSFFQSDIREVAYKHKFCLCDYSHFPLLYSTFILVMIQIFY